MTPPPDPPQAADATAALAAQVASLRGQVRALFARLDNAGLAPSPAERTKTLNQPLNNPDPWHDPRHPLPDLRPVLTAEEEADWEAYQDQVEHMQALEMNQRAEWDPNLTPSSPWPDRPVTWEPRGQAETQAEAGHEAEAGQ